MLSANSSINFSTESGYLNIASNKSSRVNFGKLKKGKFDEREIFLKKLIKNYPNINFNILGISGEKPKWNYQFMDESVHSSID